MKKYNGEDRTVPIILLPESDSESCYTHDAIWHEGQTCEQYEKSKIQPDLVTEAYLSQKTKKCSRCEVYIEKFGGFNHITCKCQMNFVGFKYIFLS